VKIDVPRPVQRAGKDLSVRWGRITAPLRMSPGFLICGAQRCGTTTMYRTLSQHPGVLPAVLHKGVHYFDTGYANGRGWYQAHFPLQSTARRAERRTATAPMTFESSPYYLFHPLAAQRIARDLPGVRIIVLLRDPVERAYSAHTHESARGFETESFERALELEDGRLAGEEDRIVADETYNSHSHQHHSYLARGRYIHQVRRMEAAVGPDRLHVLDAEDMFTDPEPVWRDVAEFLGLSPEPLPRFEQHNARPRTTMDGSLRTALREKFEADDAELEAWWGRVPSWRR
jgi:hypothetical protein